MFYKTHVDLLSDLLLAGQLRGRDGTGLFRIDSHNKVDWLKIAGGAENLMADKSFDDFEKAIFSKGQAVVGHNRYATSGGRGTLQAHPFQHEHITLVHNGFVSSTNAKDKDKNLKCEVDSHSFCIDLAQSGDDWKELLQKTTGAFCFVWHDARDNTIRIYRNDQRPLSFYENDDLVLFASERGMAAWCAGRRGLKMDYREAAPDVLYSIDLNVNQRFLKEERLPSKKHGVVVYHGGNQYTTPAVNSNKFTPPDSKYKVGDTVIFSCYDERHNGTLWHYYGIVEDDSDIKEQTEVCFLSKNRQKTFLDSPLIKGTINALLKDGTVQVSTKTLEVVATAEVSKLTKEEPPFDNDSGEYVRLKDGVSMLKERFKMWADMRCPGCRDQISMEDAPFCSWSSANSGLFCPDCTTVVENADLATKGMVH